MAKTVGIVGAGVSGLATAMRLAYHNLDVEVHEKLSRPGGRNNIIEDKGFKFDTGPSFVLMPDFFNELFSYCGLDIKDYLDLRALDVHYKIFFSDRKTLTVYHDTKLTCEQLERIEPGSSRRFNDFINATGDIYKAVKPLLYRCFSAKDILSIRYMWLPFKLHIFKSYWDIASKYFKSEKLRYAFTFEAMFMGVSCFDAPAFYSIISYADHMQKVFHPMGGMYKIPQALESICRKFGVKFYYDHPAEKISHGHSGLTIRFKEKEVSYDAVVSSADYSYTQRHLLGRKLPQYKYSCSVFLIYLGLKKKISHLAHHNLFFSSDIKRNLHEIFQTVQAPFDPSFYVHVPTVTDQSLAPMDKEILYILIPTANLEHTEDSLRGHRERLRKITLDKISHVCGQNVEDLIEIEHHFYPADFIGRYNIEYGATFGLAHNLMQSAFFRPVNYDSRIKNLFYVGASTQPGGGLPPVIASSRIAAGLILR
ncbi:MAG: phytoene desaturase family protein [Candidatus Omnitrophica bacterium]|jgi:phytoene desaturase|nr:phytoene desaturase family protein [Candidatus Omnitrophota bacterium]